MNKPADRSKLFLPFAALTGFDELVQTRTAVQPRRKERTDEENEMLSRRMLALRRGMQVCVTYWENGACRTHRGVVRQADCALRELILTDKRVPFDDIYALEFRYNNSDSPAQGRCSQ